MKVDQAGEGGRVGFLADMPVMRPSQLAQSGAPTSVGHRGQPEIDPVRQDRGQQRFFVVGRPPIPLMREALGEPRPAIHVEQHICDLGARQQIIGGLPQCFGFRRHDVAQGRDLQFAP